MDLECHWLQWHSWAVEITAALVGKFFYKFDMMDNPIIFFLLIFSLSVGKKRQQTERVYSALQSYCFPLLLCVNIVAPYFVKWRWYLLISFFIYFSFLISLMRNVSERLKRAGINHFRRFADFFFFFWRIWYSNSPDWGNVLILLDYSHSICVSVCLCPLDSQFDCLYKKIKLSYNCMFSF